MDAPRVRQQEPADTADVRRRREPSPAPATPCVPGPWDASPPDARTTSTSAENASPSAERFPSEVTHPHGDARSPKVNGRLPGDRRGRSVRLPPKSPDRTGMLHASTVDNTVRSPVPAAIAGFAAGRPRITPGAPWEPSAAAPRQQLPGPRSSHGNSTSSVVSCGRSGRPSATTVPIRTGMHRPTSVRRANPGPASPSSDNHAVRRPEPVRYASETAGKSPKQARNAVPDVPKREVGRPRRRTVKRQILSTYQSFSEVRPWLQREADRGLMMARNQKKDRARYRTFGGSQGTRPKSASAPLPGDGLRRPNGPRRKCACGAWRKPWRAAGGTLRARPRAP